MGQDIDIFGDAEANLPDEGGLGKLKQLYDRYESTEQRVEELRAQLKAEEAVLREISEKQFPDLFDEVGITSFKAGNREISVQEKLYGSLPSKDDTREAAMEELNRHGGDKLIKAEVVTTFDKGSSEQAQQLALELYEKGLATVLKESVHASSLQAWAREQLGDGKDINLEVLGLYNRRFVKVK